MTSKTSKVHSKCAKCIPARCCLYIAVKIPEPRTRRDFEDLLWYMAHKKVSLYVHNKQWHVNFDSRCQFLGSNNLCSNYEQRPLVCRQYSPDDCPDSGCDDYDFALEFKTYQQFRDYIINVRKIKIS